MSSMSPATRTAIPTTSPAEAPPAVTMAELIGVLSDLTDDEDEIVATLFHMVETRSVRLVVPPYPEA